MKKCIYLINPKANVGGYCTGEFFAYLGKSSGQTMGDLAITTVAAMIPEDFVVYLCDEYIMSIDFDIAADFVGITGKTTQVERMIEIATEFRRRGKIVLIGGPYASLDPEKIRPYCDILVRGEIENIAAKLFADLRNGTWQKEYCGDRPQLQNSPIPRWDLYPNEPTLSGALQTSRGCPFECEFCDVTNYLGRKQRHKTAKQVLAELEVLRNHGYYHVFLSDDNFAVYRQHAKSIATALCDWQDRQSMVTFYTQTSIDIADDEELLSLCAKAGINSLFIGIETPNVASLASVNKRQNMHVDLQQQIQKIVEHGILIHGGMIAGFDADEIDIFTTHYQFAMSTAVPIWGAGALVAPVGTKLYAKLQRENRLHQGNFYIGTPWDTNIIPKRMSREQLFTGLKWLANKLYQPDAFATRLVKFIEQFNQREITLDWTHNQKIKRRKIHVEVANVIRNLVRTGRKEQQMYERISAATAKKPATKGLVLGALFYYAQVRYLYQTNGLWQPELAKQDNPFA